MSHSTVLVVLDPGNPPYSVPQALEPFDENTEVEPYFKPWDDFDKEHLVPKFVDMGKDEITDEVEDWCGAKPHFDSNGNCTGYYSTYNPNSKWDWYQIGGRWTGYWQLKPGKKGVRGEKSLLMETGALPGRYDIAFKCDIDFEAMAEDARAQAAGEFDGFAMLKAPPHLPWKEFYDNYDIDTARNLYNSQPAVVKYRAESPWDSPDKFLVGREKYIEDAALNAPVTFAVLYNGDWYEKGKMGWFGMVSDENEDWPKIWHKIVDALPDYAILTVVDCHI